MGLALGGSMAGVVLIAAPVAQAHDWLVASNPPANSNVTQAPADVALTFNEPVLTKPAPPRVAVLGPGGTHYETGCASALGSTVKVPWTAGAPGRYEVEWRVISADGHPVSDSITFTYAGRSGPNKGAQNSPKCSGTQGGSSVADASEGSGDAGGQGSSTGSDTTPVYVAGGAALAAAAAVSALVIRSRRRDEGTPRASR